MVHIIESLAPVLLFIEKSILALLIFLEAAIVAVFLWRLRDFSQVQGDAPKWIKVLTQNLQRQGMAGILVPEKDAATVSGRVVKTGLENEGLAPEALKEVFESQESIEKRTLDRGLAFLGTVGANAPFLGLTGTVI